MEEVLLHIRDVSLVKPLLKDYMVQMNSNASNTEPFIPGCV
jgi:hypothetical protein